MGAVIHDVDVRVSGVSTAGKQYPLFYCQEFSRRTSIRNIRVTGSDVVLGNIVMAMAGGHSFENIHVTARSFDKLLDYFCNDPGLFSLNHLPLTLKWVTVDTTDADTASTTASFFIIIILAVRSRMSRCRMASLMAR